MSTPRNMIGPNLRRIRCELGLTQFALASICQRKGWDLSRETLAKIEGQVRWVADFELVFLSNVLDVPIYDLLPKQASWNVAKKLVAQLEQNQEE